MNRYLPKQKKMKEKKNTDLVANELVETNRMVQIQKQMSETKNHDNNSHHKEIAKIELPSRNRKTKQNKLISKYCTKGGKQHVNYKERTDIF